MGKFQRPRASRARFDRRDHDMRIVVKVGTSTLAHPTGRLNIQRMEKLCKVLSDLKNMGHEIILVSSGAIAMGFGKLNLSERPKDVPTKQASAAVGQCELMYIYDKLFTEANMNAIPEGSDYKDYLNPESVVARKGCKLEEALAGAKPGEKFQFVRTGFFTPDSKNPGVYNRVVTLRDSFKPAK